MILLLAILLPVVFGALLPAIKLPVKARNVYLLVVSLATSVLAALAIFSDIQAVELIRFNEKLSIALYLDDLGRVFVAVIAVLWPLSMVYATVYMKNAEKQNSFFTFFLMSYGVTLGIAMSRNLLTLYVFYEMMTLSTLPLVMHGGSQKSIRAGLKYLYYSLGGSAFAFISLVYLVYFGGTTEFMPGGLFTGVAAAHTSQLRIGYLLSFFGFSVKAAVFPLHDWLPDASVAPTPVTALLHAVAVVKSGVFAVIRVTYFSFGISVLKGSYAQYIPLALSAFTIVYGCTMALKEKHLKRRLAYSTVSNLSYIVFGCMLMTSDGLTAGLMHLVFHAVMKITLFFASGIYNQNANAYYVDQLRGLARKLPVLTAIFTLGALAMTGIPPLIGFVSKWYLALAAVNAGGLLPLLGVLALLASAVLTAIYLIVPAVTMYSRPLSEERIIQPIQLGYKVTMATLTVVMLGLSFFTKPLIDFLMRTASMTV